MSGPSPDPLVSIGVPTYNRVGTLRRTLESALAQTYPDIEVVVSDNASTDGTEVFCSDLAARNPRVHYLREPVDRGPTVNFNALIKAFRGEYAMMLADDDWIDEGYVAACIAKLEADPDYALVCGAARYFRDGACVTTGVEVQLPQQSSVARVRSYYRQVEDNGTFYGVMRREAMVRSAPLRNVLGNDWLFVAAIAFQGKIATLPNVGVNRTLGDTTSASIESIARMFDLPAFHARIPHLVMAWDVFRDIAWSAPVYAPLGKTRRVLLGLAVAPSVVNWRALAWHLTAPTARRLGRRRRTRWAYRLYDRITRMLGAGRSI